MKLSGKVYISGSLASLLVCSNYLKQGGLYELFSILGDISWMIW